MNGHKVWISATSTILLSAAIASESKASDVLYQNSGFVQGTQSFVQSFDLSGPGTLTVTLSNIDWPQKLSSLQLLVSTSSGVMDPMMGGDSETFKVTAGEEVFTQWFGKAQGPLDIGVYSMEVEFEREGGAVVSLPTSIGLFVSGLGLLVWQRRPRILGGDALMA